VFRAVLLIPRQFFIFLRNNGVHHRLLQTAIYALLFLVTLLAVLGLLLSGKHLRGGAMACIAVFTVTCAMNSGFAMKAYHIVSDDAYNIIRVVDVPNEDSVLLEMNRSSFSKWSHDPEKRFANVKYIEENFITPISAPGHPPRDILIIGAGGFTMGLRDTVNNYTFVDIDTALKDVSEKISCRRSWGLTSILFPRRPAPLCIIKTGNTTLSSLTSTR
jgi:hypothetical protein